MNKGMMNGEFMGWGGMMGGPLMMLLVLVFLTAAAVIIVRMLIGKSRSNSDAIAILKSRFAAGEISEEEFKKRRSVLRG